MRLTKEDIIALRDKVLGSMPEAIREVAQALRLSDAPPPDTPAAKELVAAVEQVTLKLHRELMAYERVFDGDAFHGRLLVYERVIRSGQTHWSMSRMEYAGTRVMAGEAEQLRSLAEHVLNDCDEHSIALWVTSAPAPAGTHLYFIYARHPDGIECVFVMHSGRLHRLPVEGKHLDTVLEMVAPAHSLERGYWKRVLESLGSLADSELRPDLEKYLLEKHQLKVTPEVWKELLKHFYLNMDYLRFQMEVGRSVATPVLQEAQVLLTALVEGLERASAMFDERLEQAKRDHRRELKRRISDHEKLDAAYKGLQRRAQRQAEELSQFLRATPTSRDGPVTAQVSLGQTLRHFF